MSNGIVTEKPDPDEEFVRNVTSHQHRLYGLILSMLPDPEPARDVLQETNVVLWRKHREFTPGTNFGAWAAKIAYFQVTAYRTRCGRDRHQFDDSLVATICASSSERLEREDDRTVALESCMDRMKPNDRELLRERYTGGNSVTDLAKKIGKSASATRVALFRLRHLLLECIERKLEHSQD